MSPEMERLQSEITSSLQGLSARDTQCTPADRPGHWSIQQIAEHLLLTYRVSRESFQLRLNKRRATKALPTFGQRVFQVLIISLGRFPSRREAPANVFPAKPVVLQNGSELSARVRTELRLFDEDADRAQTLFGNDRAISHPVLGPLSTRQWRSFHLIHGLHHLKQIRGVRRDHSL